MARFATAYGPRFDLVNKLIAEVRPNTKVRADCAIISDMPVKLREKVRVIMHLPETYTKVLVERTPGVGLADGGTYWDIPTKVIPPHLRQMGPRFIVEATGLTGRLEAEKMTAEEMRSAIEYSVEEIRDE